jgi:hypothetical protein
MTIRRFNRSSSRKQRGNLLLAVLGVFALVAIALAAFTALKPGNKSAMASTASGGMATQIKSQLSNLSAGYSMAANKGIAPGGVTLDSASTTGLYNPYVGGVLPEQPPAKALTDTTAVYGVTSISMPGIGTLAGLDRVLFLKGVSYTVCAATMVDLRGTGTLSVSSSTAAVLVAGGVALNGTPVQDGLSSGCFVSSDGVFIEYMVVEDN